MTAKILDGKKVANLQLAATKIGVEAFLERAHRPPGLAVVLVGCDPASQIYVANKRQACKDIDIKSCAYDLDATTSEATLLKLIQELNEASDIDGILVQLPLPAHINETAIIEAINPKKDVDGFHPYNAGRLLQANPMLRPCTPKGIIDLLAHYDVPIKSKHAVVVGASNIVGRPMAMELLMQGATVTICHSKTDDLKAHVMMADILVVAVGIKDLISPDWIKPTAAVIDVGIHRLENGKLRGDLDFDALKSKVAYLTPVPGGVGPMTIASLMANTLMAANIFCLSKMQF